MNHHQTHHTGEEYAEESRPVRPSIRELEVGQWVEFPIFQMGSARTAAYELGKRLKRKFETETIDEDTYRVTRTA